MDFLMISTRSTKRGTIEIYPKFVIRNPSQDLMIRGGDFYAIWIEEKGLWSTNEQDALQMIDRELDKFVEENRQKFDGNNIKVLHMWDAESGMIDRWHKYCQKQMRDSFHMLDEKLIFSNTETTKKDYASRRLAYPLEECRTDAYDRLLSVLYSKEERHKIEWAIGSVLAGDSKKLQKFMVLYGAAGTGKSTVLNIIQQLFEGYYSVFDARALGSSNNSFALEAFKSNPLVAIQHDGDLSRIEDNTRLNSLVSHELMTVNEKFKSAYSNRFKCFLFMGTNKPVKITDAKSGLLRRLIDVSPSGNKVPTREYNSLVKQVGFELGGIALKCKAVYESDPGYYDNYIPVNMIAASNNFYNFVEDNYFVFKSEDGVTLQRAWEMYKTYCDEAKVGFPLNKMVFQEELKNYFDEFLPRIQLEDGTRPRNYYSGFKAKKFKRFDPEENKEESKPWLEFDSTKSIFDKEYADCFAQYANVREAPTVKWEKCKSKLSEIDTTQLHYVKIPENVITIDFDIPDQDGNKSFEKNLIEAAKWPPTYAELSKSGSGIHLHYIYTGDPKMLSRQYADHIEIKVPVGNSSLRRKLTKCNNLPIASISSGLPLKEDKGEKMVNFDTVKSEKGLRKLIERNLNKEIHPGTKPSVDFIFKILEEAYESGLNYDVSDMKSKVYSFAAASTHQSEYCLKLVGKMKFKSEEVSKPGKDESDTLIFYDVEVFPNLFLINWKAEGEGTNVVRMINPTPADVEELLKFKLVGFNCRRYDNHILYARLMGYTNEQLYNLSQKIISGNRNCFFGEAYNISYTDVYDFASAGNKKSLKKLEVEMGIHHQELGLPWDKDVPEELWPKVAEYCDNDVIATEAAFHYLNGDWTARQILADLAGMTVNDTTNSLTTRIIFGTNRHPQDQFNYRFMGDVDDREIDTPSGDWYDSDYAVFQDGKPVFPGYVYDNGKSFYRGEEIGEGGYVYAEPGIYTDVALLDIASMHPSSIVAENLFGDAYTKRFREILDARLAIKHEDWKKVNKMLDGKLAKHVQRVIDGEITSKQLANALKTAINSVYGLTDAGFENPFRDIRNKDNIVAKRGALFMVNLKNEVQKRGFTVAHIKTDSIKIPNANDEIIKFVMEYGKMYGYTFEHEATYDRMCLVNNAVYIARYKEKDGSLGKWTATGTQFQVPYVFKKCFSHEEIVFDDLCETKSVTSALYLDMNESLPDVSDLEKEYAKMLKDNPEDPRLEKMKAEIDKGHNYIFVGKVGQFCPIKQGCGGGLLMREGNGKYYAATGSSGYRWLESEVVREMKKQDSIDESYYISMVDDAIAEISQYGDYELFASDDPYPRPIPDDFMNVPKPLPGEEEKAFNE